MTFYSCELIPIVYCHVQFPRKRKVNKNAVPLILLHRFMVNLRGKKILSTWKSLGFWCLLTNDFVRGQSVKCRRERMRSMLINFKNKLQFIFEYIFSSCDWVLCCASVFSWFDARDVPFLWNHHIQEPKKNFYALHSFTLQHVAADVSTRLRC